MLLKRRSIDDNQALKRIAVMLSCGINGASVEWRRNSEVQPEKFIKSLIPFISEQCLALFVKDDYAKSNRLFNAQKG